MNDLEFYIPKKESSIIKVIGVGGGGSNAVNQMFSMNVKGVDFVICNTDEQALKSSPVPIKIQLGTSLTEGRGAGNNPEKGKEAAIENLADIEKVLDDNTKMVFITAGMGGGTGTGAAPVIAKAAKERDILTIAIVSIPFRVEGELRINQARNGIEEMEKFVDALLIIDNEKLQNIYMDLKMSNAFGKADEVLAIATKGIAEIITIHGYINVDFEDVKTVMKDSGVALMGSAKASGENRDTNAIKAALESPLLKDNNIRGAKNILLNIMSAKGEHELSMNEFGKITSYLKEAVGKDTNVIWGSGHDDSLDDEISVTIIATGFRTRKELYDTDNRVVINIDANTDVSRLDNDLFTPITNTEDSNNNVIELKIDFIEDSELEEIIAPDTNQTHFKHVEDIDKLNDSAYLEKIEEESALERKRNQNNNNSDK